MTAKTRHRLGQVRRGPSPAERLYLMHGSVTGDAYGVAFSRRGPDGWTMDEAAARAAWREFGDELTADMPAGLVPWAARQFDGAIGPSSRYEHLRCAETFAPAARAAIQATPQRPFEPEGDTNHEYH
jgi:hypothetical protein